MKESSKVSSVLEQLLPHKDQITIGSMQSLYAGVGKPTWRVHEHMLQCFSDLAGDENIALANNPQIELTTVESVREYYAQLREKAIACDDGAINDLGWHFLNGFELAYEPLLAQKLFKIAAADEAVMAFFNLGQQAYYGKGMAVDVALAVDYYEKALAEAHPWAALELGRLYDTQDSDDEHDLPYDHAKAIAYYKQAAEWKLYEAGFYLGRLLLKRQTKHYNLAEALYWLQWSATNGYSLSSEALASYYVEDCFLDFPRDAARSLYCFWRDFSIKQSGYYSEQWLELDESIDVPNSHCLDGL